MVNNYLEHSENGFVTIDAIDRLKREIELRKDNDNKILDFLNESIKCLEKGLQLEKSTKKILNLASLAIGIIILMTQISLIFKGVRLFSLVLTTLYILPISFSIRVNFDYKNISNAIKNTLELVVKERDTILNQLNTKKTKEQNNKQTKTPTKKLDELNYKMQKAYNEGYYKEESKLKRKILIK